MKQHSTERATNIVPERVIHPRVCSGTLLDSRCAVSWRHPSVAGVACCIVAVLDAVQRTIIRAYDNIVMRAHEMIVYARENQEPDMDKVLRIRGPNHGTDSNAVDHGRPW